jgi:hypothetical protein
MASLKHLSRKPLRGLDIARVIQTLPRMPDQAYALVFGALLERFLERRILERMVRLSKKRKNELFVGIAPLASFSSKIKFAYALGIVGTRGAAELETIKDIRNQFAHSFHPLKFENKTIAAACKSLKTPERVLQGMPTTKLAEQMAQGGNPRSRFGVSCAGVLVALGGKTTTAKRPKLSRGTLARIILN